MGGVQNTLDVIVAEAYAVFGKYQIGGALTVCHCDCCMTDETEKRLVKTPLREIPNSLLAEYTNSAHGWDNGSILEQMRYFLPRYLELMAAGEVPGYLGLEYVLSRLKDSNWRADWPKQEIDILERFFDALMVHALQDLELAHWPVGWKLAANISDVLGLVILSHGDLDRILAVWDHAADPGAALHMAAERDWLAWKNGELTLNRATLESYANQTTKIVAFLTRPDVDRRLEAAFFTVADERHQKILSDAIWPTG